MDIRKTKMSCERCNEEFTISKDTMRYQVPCISKDNEINEIDCIHVTYLVCPKCKKRHFVQIDSFETINALEEYKKRFAKNVIRRRRGKPVGKGESKRLIEKAEFVKNERAELAKLYNKDTISFEEEGNVVTCTLNLRVLD